MVTHAAARPASSSAPRSRTPGPAVCLGALRFLKFSRKLPDAQGTGPQVLSSHWDTGPPPPASSAARLAWGPSGCGTNGTLTEGRAGAHPSGLACPPLQGGTRNRKRRGRPGGSPGAGAGCASPKTRFGASSAELTLDIIALASSTVFFKTCFIFSFGATKMKKERGRERASFEALLKHPEPFRLSWGL